MRVAGIDCGTNSIRLLIADITGTAPLQDVVRTMDIVYLGQGVDERGEFAAEALERTLAAVDEYAKLCEANGVESIRFAATSATRDARNRDIFLDGVQRRLGIRPQVLSGEREAQTSFAGAISALPAEGETPILAVDLGGGSTELVLGTREGEVLSEFSMNVGSVRMRERHLHSDPPLPAEVEAARMDVRRALDEAEQYVDLGAAREVVGLAGTVTSVTAKWLELDAYEPERIHGTRMPIEDILAVTEWFIHSPRSEREALGFMHPGRVPMIPSGALVWQEVVNRVAQRVAERAAAEVAVGDGVPAEGVPAEHVLAEGVHAVGAPALSTVTTSEHDILDGLALWAAREPQKPAR
ncbi:Ppx/GppA phosphatase family protein [Actinobaculum massiliense]|uniref:Ppx/GppA phosphatase family protein n=1 Tax=Actinobaculum massiliense TaxID=202789 RepID=UPI002804942B|nr:Ppx/GppA phosphatase family protein [Actinobaculum massiliense]